MQLNNHTNAFIINFIVSGIKLNIVWLGDGNGWFYTDHINVRKKYSDHAKEDVAASNYLNNKTLYNI